MSITESVYPKKLMMYSANLLMSLSCIPFLPSVFFNAKTSSSILTTDIVLSLEATPYIPFWIIIRTQ